MTLPTPIQTGAIVGHFIDESGRPLRGSVSASYDRRILLAPGATPPTSIITRSKSVALDPSTGDVDIQGLILSDSPGLRRTTRAVLA